jgi:predicted dehydrogenase
MGESRLRVAVLGVGYLGALHASKVAALADAELACVYDTDAGRAAEVAAKYTTTAAATLDEAIAAADAVSIVVPTEAHLEVGLRAVAAGKPMLVEKPLAATAEAGARLVAAAREAGLPLQVGHLERFNPVFQDLRRIVDTPRFIECHRLSPFAGRGTDTSVVHDLMIHDLDLITFLVGRPVVEVEAVGVPVLSKHEDICNARLRFEGGAIANVTASRVSLKRERKLRIFQSDAYASVDLDKREAVIARRKADAPEFDPAAPMDSIDVEVRSFEGADPLGDEIAAFVACVREGRAPVVDGQAGLAALELAERVVAAARASRSELED